MLRHQLFAVTKSRFGFSVAASTPSLSLLSSSKRFQGRTGPPSFSSKPEHMENPDLSETSPFQGAKGMYTQSEFKSKMRETDFEQEQFNKYYKNASSSSSSTASTATSTTSKPITNTSSSSSSSTTSTKFDSPIHLGESPFGLRRRKLEHEAMEEEGDSPDIVRVLPFVRRREAQSHYHGTKPHGTTFHNMKESPQEVRAPGTVVSDQLLPPPTIVRFMAFPKRYIWESLNWLPATVVSTGKYAEPPQAVAARIEAKKREWAKLQEQDKYGGGNDFLGRASEADPEDEGILTKPKKVKQVDGETEVLGTLLLNDFIFKAGINGAMFFFLLFFWVSFFGN